MDVNTQEIYLLNPICLSTELKKAPVSVISYFADNNRSIETKRLLPVAVGFLSVIGLLPFHRGLSPGCMSVMSLPLSVGTTFSSGIPILFPVR